MQDTTQTANRFFKCYAYSILIVMMILSLATVTSVYLAFIIIINLLGNLCQPQFVVFKKICMSRMIKNLFVFVAQGLALSVRQPSFRLRVSHYSQ